MATVKGILVVGVTIAAAAGVYFGLNKAFPKHVEKGEMPDIVASADEVFSKTISEEQPLQAKAPPPTAPPTTIAEGEPPPVAGTTAAPAPQAEPTPATKPETSAPPPAEPAKPAPPPQASQQALLVPEPAPEPATAPKSQPTPTPETTVPAPAKPAPAPKPAPEKPAPAPAKPAPASPAPTSAAPAAAAPKKLAPAPTESATSARWWGDPKEQDPRKLNLSYAGQAAGQKGIALLFNGSFASAGVANFIKVVDANGKPAAGHWELGASPKMLVFKGIGPGKYTVTILPELKDAQGKTLGRRLSGPVTVQ